MTASKDGSEQPAATQQTAAGSPVAPVHGNTRQQYQELISTMGEADLREICGEEGLTVPPQLAAAAVREILWAHFDAKLSALGADSATAASSTARTFANDSSVSSPRDAPAEQPIQLRPERSRALPSHFSPALGV